MDADDYRHMQELLRKTSSHRKYLGGSDDLHFVPSSPIITRQQLTFEEEEELTRSCTLVLSGVQHADEAEEDPLLKYITNHLASKPRPLPQKDTSIVTQHAVRNDTHFFDVLRDSQKDTATPSEISKRDTMDRTDASTPLTILSDGLCRPPSTRQNTAVRNDSKSSRTRPLHNGLENNIRKSQQSATVVIAKPVMSLSGQQPQIHGQTIYSAENSGRKSTSHLEMNKKLPTLPQLTESDSATRPQNSGFSRVFKTVRKEKNVPEETSLPPFTIVRSQTAPVSNSRRHKFNFRNLFTRKKTHRPTQIPVI